MQQSVTYGQALSYSVVSRKAKDKSQKGLRVLNTYIVKLAFYYMIHNKTMTIWGTWVAQLTICLQLGS